MVEAIVHGLGWAILWIIGFVVTVIVSTFIGILLSQMKGMTDKESMTMGSIAMSIAIIVYFLLTAIVLLQI